MSSFLKSRLVLSSFVLGACLLFAFSASAQVAPSNISAVSVGACQINLSWTLGSYPYTQIQAEHYTPSPTALCTFASPYTLSVTSTPAGATTYIHATNTISNDPYVGPGSLYCYRMISRTSQSGLCGGITPCSAPSQSGPGGVIASTTTPLIPPPSNATMTLALARDGGASVDLYWATSTRFSDPANAFYKVYRDSNLIGSVPAFNNVSGVFVPVGNYQDITPPAGAEHSYQIRASQSAPGCDISKWRDSALTIPLVVPTMPVITDIAYTPTTTPNKIGSLHIDWTDGVGPSGRQINLWKREANEATSTRYKSFAVGTLAYDEDPATLILDTSYGYQLQACATVFSGAKFIGAGCSDITPEAQVAIVNTPQDVRARLYYVDTQNEKADILLSWKNSFPDEPYAIEKSSNGGVDWSLVGGTSYIDSNPDTLFLYRDLGVPLKALYRYRVSLDQGSGVYTEGKETDVVSTRIEKVFYGNAYASIGPGYTPPALPSALPARLEIKNGVGFLEGLIPSVSAAFAPIPSPAPLPAPAPATIPASDGGAGWISFNSDYPGRVSVPSYSVQVDESGVLSGAAWAAIRNPNDGSTFSYGWLSFNREDLYGCPGQLPSVPCTGKWDRTTGKVTGWAKFIGFENLSGSDKWFDGWVSLAKFGSGTNSYGSATDDSLKQLIGTAWGAYRNFVFASGWVGGTGWISMGNSACPRGRCNIWYTPLTNPPLVSSVTVETRGTPWTQTITDTSVDPPVERTVAHWSGDPFCASSTYYSVSWSYTGPTLAQTQVEFYPVGGVGKTVSLDYGPILNINFPQAAQGRPLGNLAGTLDYDTDYRVRVRAATEVYDPVNSTTTLDWSAWTSGTTFHTPTHYYPFVQFTATYKGPDLSGQYQYGFDGAAVSLDRSAGGAQEYPMSGWSWTWNFGDATAGFGNPATANGNPSETAFPTTSTYPVMLTVDDGGGGVCSYTYDKVDPSINDREQPRRRIWVEP